MINLKYALMTLALGIVSSGVMVGQGYYDDDIYYDAKQEQKERREKASKKKKSEAKSTRTVTTTTTRTTTTTVPTATRQYHFGNSSTQPFHYEVVDLAGADAYNVNSGSTRDVDEYNRRYSTAGTSDGSYSAPDETEDFTYTRRIEKFHNPTIVTDSGDDDLVDYYYNSASSQPATVNIYVNNGYYDPWWGYSAWRAPWYWNTWYGPSWSLSWNSSWGWNVGWNWGWGPAWYPAPIWRPYPYYGYHGYWRPSPPGSRRPHYGAGRPNYNRPGGYRPGSRPSASGSYRPTGNRPGVGNLDRPSGQRPGSGIGQRPGGNSGQVVRPGNGLNNGSVYRPGNGSVSRPATNVSGGGQRPGAGQRPGSAINSTPVDNNSQHRVGATQSRPSTVVNGSGSSNTGRGNNSTYYRPSQSNRTPSYSRPSSSGSRGGFGGGSRGGGSRGRR